MDLSRLIETDYRNIAAAVQFCADASAYGSSEACFGNMVAEATFNFHPGSPQFLELCFPWTLIYGCSSKPLLS